MRTSDFDYYLPTNLIAQHPVEPRDHARLMVLFRDSLTWEHRTFRELPGLLRRHDVIVRNNSRVLPARLIGRRAATGGKWEGLYLRSAPEHTWEILATTRGHPTVGEWVELESGLRLELMERRSGGVWLVRPDSTEPVLTLLDRHGQVPLPPYIRKGREGPGDRERYQTTYADHPGSVAAPTAGLHFTRELFQALETRSVAVVDVTLHVGVGTFRPIETEDIEAHTLHSEWAELSSETANCISDCRALGGRTLAVGTTSVRTLEAASIQDGALKPFSGDTRLFIQPGHRFRSVDAVITNFHLPRSSLLVLVAAFAGHDFVMRAYHEAVRQEYRFYSYGDAMIIL